MRESTQDLICRLEVSPVRGPTGASVHLLTRASGEPEILALADTVGEVVLVDPRGTLRTEQAQPDIAGVAVMKRGQSTMLALAEPEGVTLIREQDGRRLVDRLGCHEGRSTYCRLCSARTVSRAGSYRGMSAATCSAGRSLGERPRSAAASTASRSAVLWRRGWPTDANRF